MSALSPSQPEVVIYGTAWCPYCRRAKALLDRLGVRYREIDVDAEPVKRREMMARAQGRRTVPQIFIDGRGIGGYDDLQALQAAGKLDGLLARGRQGETPTRLPDENRAPNANAPKGLNTGGRIGVTGIGNPLMARLRAWLKSVS